MYRVYRQTHMHTAMSSYVHDWLSRKFTCLSSEILMAPAPQTGRGTRISRHASAETPVPSGEKLQVSMDCIRLRKTWLLLRFWEKQFASHCTEVSFGV